MSSTQLFAQAPDRIRLNSSHREFTDTIRSKSIRVSTLECNTLVTDNLVDRNGDIVIVDDNILLSETASQSSPGAANGLVWVRSDTPNVAIFTNDEGTDVQLTPDISSVLDVSSDAQNQSLVNLNKLGFQSGVLIGTISGGATGTNTTHVAIGENSRSERLSCSIGRNANSNTVQKGVNIGYNCEMVKKTGSTQIGSICMGANVYSYAGAVVNIGRNITNRCLSNDDNLRASIAIGQNIEVSQPANILIGNSVNPGPTGQNICIGNAITSTKSNATYQNIILGHNVSVGTNYTISIGNNITTSTPDGDEQGVVIVGHNASSTDQYTITIGDNATTSKPHAIAIGRQANCAGESSAAIGAYASVGATSYRQIVIGSGSSSTHSNGAIIGANIASRTDSELAMRSRRLVRNDDALVLANGATGRLITFPTLAGDVLYVDIKVVAYAQDLSGSFSTRVSRLNFRNKNGTLTLSSALTSSLQNTNDNASGISSAVGISGTDIIVDATNNAGGGSWSFDAVMHIHCSPLA